MLYLRNSDKYTSKIKAIFTLITGVLMICCAIKYSKECSQGVISGISFCISVLIPSLFVFMAIATYIANSKISATLSRPLSFFTQRLLHLPDICSSAILLSVLGGYPVGAQCVSQLYLNESINKEQARKLSLIAVCSGPGFVLNYVGSALLGNKNTALIILLSQLLSFVTVALLCGSIIKTKTDYTITGNKKYSYSVVDAVLNACNATINMCAMVVAFSAIISVCDTAFAHQPVLNDTITALLEVTTACNKLSAKYPLYVTSFIIGFGGLSVHFQIFSTLKDIEINKILFFLFRIIQGILAGAVTYVLLILFDIKTEVFSTVKNVQGTTSVPIWGSLALIITAICFINSINYQKMIRR